MIENILMLLKATLADESVNAEALIEQCHPLGLFKESTMKTIVAFNNSPSGYADLYSTVLVDTPVGTWAMVGCLLSAHPTATLLPPLCAASSIGSAMRGGVSLEEGGVGWGGVGGLGCGGERDIHPPVHPCVCLFVCVVWCGVVCRQVLLPVPAGPD
jgi:hypothetical protein